MKANNPHDAVLSELLRLRRITVTLPPRFCDGVWRRIEQEEAGSNFTLFAALTAWIESTLPRPQIAFCYVTALMIVGMASGLWTAHTSWSWKSHPR